MSSIFGKKELKSNKKYFKNLKTLQNHLHIFYYNVFRYTTYESEQMAYLLTRNLQKSRVRLRRGIILCNPRCHTSQALSVLNGPRGLEGNALGRLADILPIGVWSIATFSLRQEGFPSSIAPFRLQYPCGK